MCCWYEGLTLSETIFGWVLWVKEHPQEFRNLGFFTRPLRYSHDESFPSSVFTFVADQHILRFQ